MDVFSHGFWAGAAYKGINEFALKPKGKKPLNFWWAAFWSVFPDIFAFAILFVWLFGNVIFGDLKLSDWPKPEAMEPMALKISPWVYQLTNFFYNFSHSILIFFIIFAGALLISRKPTWELGGPPNQGRGSPIPWEMGGWLIHILIDIPTHSYQFYPTPFLWPVSGFKFDGFSWGTPWFLVLNYSLILLVYIFFRLRNKKSPKI